MANNNNNNKHSNMLNQAKFELEQNEFHLKEKQALLIDLENKKQETMINIFKLQGSIQSLKELIDYTNKDTGA
jgi:hypothetical protein